MTATLRAPGIYAMSDAEYHADPALSSSGARKLLPPSCPALFQYERENPPEPKAVFELGHAAHKMVLGVGPDIVKVDFPDWRTKVAQNERDDLRAAGKVPLLADDYETVQAMAAAILRHPIASRLFAEDGGIGEPSLFWEDDQAHIQRRARLDWLPKANRHGRLIIPDYKTTRCAETDKFAKSAMDYGYHQQAAWYCDAVRALDLAKAPVFIFVAQEKVAPYLVNVIELDPTAMRIGELLNRRAIDTFAQCMKSGRWPGYSDEVELGSLPVYYTRLFEDEL